MVNEGIAAGAMAVELQKNGGMAEVARVEVTSAEGASEATPKAEVTVEVIAMKKM